jgi:hypothetical protein
MEYKNFERALANYESKIKENNIDNFLFLSIEEKLNGKTATIDDIKTALKEILFYNFSNTKISTETALVVDLSESNNTF